MINDYSSLKSSIAGWLARADLTGAIPDFITLGEAAINRELRVHQMLKTVTRTAVLFEGAPVTFQGGVITYVMDDDGRMELPADYLEMLGVAALKDGRTVPLDNRYFMVDADSIRFNPASVPHEFSYWARIPALTDTAPQNWLLSKEPGIYLYAALVEAAPYIQDDGRIAIWTGKLSEIIARLNAQDVGARFGTARMRPVGMVATP